MVTPISKRWKIEGDPEEWYCAVASHIHGDRYDYSQCKFVDGKRYVIISCPEHFEFKQRADVHLNGGNCPYCAPREKWDYELNEESFLECARWVHGSTYDYSKVKWKSEFDQVVIICPDHGEFRRFPREHAWAYSKGCQACTTHGFNPGNAGTLYYLKVKSRYRTLYKIGITNHEDVLARWERREDIKKITVLKTWRYKNGERARTREYNILKKYALLKYKGKAILQSGNSELFVEDVLGLDK